LEINEEHKKKKIAPIVITVIMIIYYCAYFGLMITVIDSLIIKILMGIIPLALSGTMIYVCIQRINEINGGEEDDISKY
jgi:hypothetical protein